MCSFTTGDQLAVLARWIHHRQTGSNLAVESDPAVVESVVTSVRVPVLRSRLTSTLHVRLLSKEFASAIVVR